MRAAVGRGAAGVARAQHDGAPDGAPDGAIPGTATGPALGTGNDKAGAAA